MDVGKWNFVTRCMLTPLSQDAPVLAVDVDGTLLKTDLLLESFLKAVKRNLFVLFLAPLWLFKGRAYLKRELARRVSIRNDLLPFNEDVLGYMRMEHRAGRRIVVISASDESLIKPLVATLDCVDECIASDGQTNMKGRHKRQLLEARYPAYNYIGNSLADVPVWEGARKVFIVGPSARFARQLQRQFPESAVFSGGRSVMRVFLKALRVHQWVKNLLLLAPIVMAHKLNDPYALRHVIIAILSFCLTSSAVYVLNDLVDLEADRAHPKKKNRPFASGALSLAVGFALVPILFFGGALLSFFVNEAFQGLLLMYVVATVAYSFKLKQVALIDILLLAGLYTLRLVAGGAAATVPLSPWALAFSMFIFLSLAAAKRFVELQRLVGESKDVVPGRGYLPSDVTPIGLFGISGGFISILVLALYVTGPDVVLLYTQPQYLLLICPLLLYWVTRVWLLAFRRELDEDPIVFALKDPASYAVGLLSAIIMFLAI